MSSAFAPLARGCALAAIFACSGALLRGQCGIDTNYGANLQLGDDAVSGRQALGFSFPFAGASYDSVYVSSNGFLYLYDSNGTIGPPSDPRCCLGNPFALIASPHPMVSAFWTDLNPSNVGSVHFNAVVGRAFVSFVGVPEFVSPPGATNTFQIVLHQSGVIELHYDSNCNAYSTTLAGWSPGGGAANPGASDLSAVPFTTTSATVYEQFGGTGFDLAGRTTRANPASPTSWAVEAPPGCAMSWVYGYGCRANPPLLLAARPGSRPVLNSTFTLGLQVVSATTASGVLVIGATNPNLNLMFLGLPPNCVLQASLDVMLPFPTTSPSTSVPVPVPNSSALTGRALNTQALVLDPAFSGLPLALSNGVRMLFGL